MYNYFQSTEVFVFIKHRQSIANINVINYLPSIAWPSVCHSCERKKITNAAFILKLSASVNGRKLFTLKNRNHRTHV